MTWQVLFLALAFAAGYALRGWLAVLWERKRSRNTEKPH